MAYSFLKISTLAGHNSLESTDGGGGLYTHLFSGDFSPGFGEIPLEGVQIWHRCGTGLGFQNGPNANTVAPQTAKMSEILAILSVHFFSASFYPIMI